MMSSKLSWGKDELALLQNMVPGVKQNNAGQIFNLAALETFV